MINQEQPKKILIFDPVLLSCVFALMVIGILFIYSSGINSSGVLIADDYIKQLIWAAIALLLLVSFNYVNYNLLKGLSLWLYVGFLLLLLATLFFGRVVNGSRSWLGFMGLGGQPSEFAKIATILFLAQFLQSRQSTIRKIPTFLGAMAIVAIPMGLILRQPDTGTMLVFVPILLLMLLVAGARISVVLFLAIAGVLSMMIAVYPSVELLILKESDGFSQILTDPFTMVVLSAALCAILLTAWIGFRKTKSSAFRWVLYGTGILLVSLLVGFTIRLFLKDYQIMRFIVFLDPSVDPKGSGWNLIQSITAIGSGGFWGKGFLEGTQSHYRFLPMQSTDFIFSILGEEWGFIGGFIVFGLFVTLLLRLLFIMAKVKDLYGALVLAGFVGMFATHLFVNVGMAIGTMPVTGIPLYFLSYGGSSLTVGAIAIGISMNIYHRRFMF